MEIEMKPVKCGDCFIVTSNQDTLIIDCGSDNAGNGLKKSQFAYSKIDDLIMNRYNNLKLLITHFDSDHYNGILEINNNNCFQNIYIPYYFHDNHEIVESFGYILLFAKNRTYVSLKCKKLVEFLIKIPKILKKTGSIQCIRAGNRVYFGKDELEVLWPEAKNHLCNQHCWQDTLNTLKIVSKSFISGVMKYNRVEYELELEKLDIEGMIYNFSRALLEYMESCLSENKERIMQNADQLKEEYENILKANRIINSAYKEIGNRIPGELFDKYTKGEVRYFDIHSCIKETHHELIKDMNSSSIVLHREEDVLFLGDVSPEVIEYLKRTGKINKKYRVVKLQHHATERYYTSNVPHSDIALVSNGGYVKRRVYGKFLDTAKQVYCTDAWKDSRYCSYLQNKGKCSSKCNKLSKGHKPLKV